MTPFKKFYIFSFPVGVVTGSLLLLNTKSVESASDWILLKCPLHFITGWLCPTCGMTRSFLAILRGELTLAFDYHPLGPLLFAFLFACWFLLLFRVDFFTQLNSWYHNYYVFKKSVHILTAIIVFWGFSRNF